MRTLFVFGDKTFKITINDDDRVTFGPWSPPVKGSLSNRESLSGTLRIYHGKSTTDIKAVFSGVTSFREDSLNYMEQFAKVESETIWKSDKDGYVSQKKVKRDVDWVEEPRNLLSRGDFVD